VLGLVSCPKMAHTNASLYSTLAEIANAYPTEEVRAAEVKDVRRIAFHIDLVRQLAGPKARVCDIGGGVGLFSVGCAAVGLAATLVDDFQDEVNREHGEALLKVHRLHGVNIISTDVIANGLALPCESFDAITSFHSIEHWHHSPKRLFRQLLDALSPGGLFLVCAPNCVNLRKRISVPFGFGRWSPMSSWYEQPVFRGHVREPDTRDLRWIARDLDLTDVRIIGRNWLGHSSGRLSTRIATSMFDRVLRPFPSLCSDIYLIGFKAHR